MDVGYREINLVVRGEKNMSKILKFLIWNVRTLDGKKGSADKILSAMNEQSFEQYRQENRKTVIDEQAEREIV